MKQGNLGWTRTNQGEKPCQGTQRPRPHLQALFANVLGAYPYLSSDHVRLFGQMAPFGPLTPLGMNLIGIFSGILYGWIFIEIVWPSLAGLLALMLIGGMKPVQLFNKSFGDPIVQMMFFIFVFCATINYYGLSKLFSSRSLVYYPQICAWQALALHLCSLWARFFHSRRPDLGLSRGHHPAGRFCTACAMPALPKRRGLSHNDGLCRHSFCRPGGHVHDTFSSRCLR